jgi:hypothetical protein
VRIAPPGAASSARIRPIGSSRNTVVFRQIGSSSVVDTTYFAGAFIRSPNGSPAGIGSNASAWVT